jgi:hypothetical protein
VAGRKKRKRKIRREVEIAMKQRIQTPEDPQPAKLAKSD